MRKFKNIDTSRAKKVNVVDIKKKKPEIEMKKGEVWEYNDTMFKIATILFPLQDTGNRFGIENENILILLYLHNLVVFRYEIRIIDRLVAPNHLKAHGYIIEDFSSSSATLYRLSEKGIAVVDYFYNSLKNIDGILMENKVIDVDAKTSLKAALFDYFQG